MPLEDDKSVTIVLVVEKEFKMEELTFISRLKRAWNSFFNKDPTTVYNNIGPGNGYRPDRNKLTRGVERTIVTSVINRIGMDVAAVDIFHVRLDENERYLEKIESGLNNCLSLEANTDQTGREFIQDIAMSMMDEGVVAIVPVYTDKDPRFTDSYDIEALRVGKIVEWYPQHVKIRLYDDRDGQKKDITLPKNVVAIVTNPLYSVMNEPNSTMQRLIRKLSLLDTIDNASASNNLNMIIQLPYAIKTEARRRQAEERLKVIEEQLTKGKYGIAYADSTEKIVQLNRSLENRLMEQVEYLTSMLFSQLGITQAILDGTADESTMLNYYSRVIEPILSAITDEMKRKFLSKTARTQMQSIEFFRDPFKLVPVSQIAEIADKFTRNEIMTSNEIRQIVGMKPSDDPRADELRNKNLSEPKGGGEDEYIDERMYLDDGGIQNE